MKTLSRNLLINLLAVAILSAGAAAADEDPHAKHRAMMKQKSEPAAESVRIDLRDQWLVDQNGRDLKFVRQHRGHGLRLHDLHHDLPRALGPVYAGSEPIG
jgi:hypothetical protein